MYEDSENAHVRTRPGTHARVHTHAYTHTHTHTHTRARARAHTHTRTHALTHTHTHSNTHRHARTHARTHIKFTNIQTASNEYKPKHFKGSALLQRFQNQHSTVQGTVHYKCTAYAQASTISGTVLSPRQKEALSLSSVFCSFSVSILL